MFLLSDPRRTDNRHIIVAFVLILFRRQFSTKFFSFFLRSSFGCFLFLFAWLSVNKWYRWITFHSSHQSSVWMACWFYLHFVHNAQRKYCLALQETIKLCCVYVSFFRRTAVGVVSKYQFSSLNSVGFRWANRILSNENTVDRLHLGSAICCETDDGLAYNITYMNTCWYIVCFVICRFSFNLNTK